MSIQRVNSIQDEAIRAYDNRPAEEAAAWAQVIAQCEIAGQLADINEKLELLVDTGGYADLGLKAISNIGLALEALNPGR